MALVLTALWTVRAEARLPAGVDIPPYPGAAVRSMGEGARFNGQDLRLYYFTTKATPEEVVGYYRHMWETAGQIVSVHQAGPHGLAVGYLDLRDGRTRTVAVWRQGEVTLGFPAVTTGMPLPLTDDARVAGPVPIPPRAEGLAAYESLEKAARFRTVNFSVAGSLESTAAFYLRQMGQRGFSLSRRTAGKEKSPSVMLDFQKGGQRLSVTLVWVPEHLRCSVFAVASGLLEQPEEKKK
jgi:hypothetical protein